MAFKMTGPPYKSALKHGTHKDPQKTQMSDFPKDRVLHKHGISNEDKLVYIPVEKKPVSKKAQPAGISPAEKKNK